MKKKPPAPQVVLRIPSERGLNARNLPLETRTLLAKRAAERRMSNEAFLRAFVVENLK